MSGIVSTIFCVSAVAFFNSGEDATFQIVLDIAISTTLISYVWIFPAALKLRYSHPEVERPYRVPFGIAGIWVGTAVITFWVALGSWVAIFPGTLERLVGVPYDFNDNWGVGRARFELYTLVTLAVILGFAVVGYILGADVRKQVVAREGDQPEPTAPVPTV
jgi:amino acid transporter